jgi:hypothetical protein
MCPSRYAGDSKLGVSVRIQYAAALDRGVSLGVVSYSEWVGRVRRHRTRLIAALGPPSVSLEDTARSRFGTVRLRETISWTYQHASSTQSS